MTVPCQHTRTGIVTSKPEPGPYIATKDAWAPVCGLPECIAWATEWVQRMSGKEAHLVVDEVRP